MKSAENGADAICAALRAAGVDTVFGVPGTQTVVLYEAMRRSRLRIVTATHEMAATFMAQGYFRASGRLAAVSTIAGPGFAFALPALAEASLDSAAVVLLTGRAPRSEDGRRRSQAIDQTTMARPIVKDVVEIEAAAQIGEEVLRACQIAIADEPGPVVVQCAPSIYRAACAAEICSRSPIRPPVADFVALREAARFVANANRLLIYAGQGAAGAADDLRRVVDVLGALVATTPSGRGVLPEDDARLLPLDATGDVAGLNSVAAGCDVVLVIGAALAENGTVGFRLGFPAERLIHVDASASTLLRPPAARMAVQATAEAFLQAVLAEIAEGARRTASSGFDLEAARQQRAGLQDQRANGPSDARIAGGDARRFFDALRRGLAADGCLVLDSGMHQLLARRHYVVARPRGLLFPSDFQSMAFGLPAAIGAKLAEPDRAVVALIGDGGLAMTGLELTTAVRLKLALPVVVFDDGALGLIRLDQLLVHGRAAGTELGRIDFAALAAAVGCAYVRAGAGEIEAEVTSALRRRGPTLIVVSVHDAPALKRARRKMLAGHAAKSMLGPHLIRALRGVRIGRRAR